jgi:hypothetical protein
MAELTPPAQLCPAASALHAALHLPLQLVRQPPEAYHVVSRGLRTPASVGTAEATVRRDAKMASRVLECMLFESGMREYAWSYCVYFRAVWAELVVMMV